MTTLTHDQVTHISNRLADTGLPQVRFVDIIDERIWRVWHILPNSPLGRNSFMTLDCQLVDTVPCEDFSTFEIILDNWLNHPFYGDGAVTSMTFLLNENITFITYNAHGIQGLWATFDTEQLMRGVVVEHKPKEVYRSHHQREVFRCWCVVVEHKPKKVFTTN